MTTPPAAAVPVTGGRPVRTWDLVLTIVLLVLSGGFGLLMLAFAPLLAMASDGCVTGVECNGVQMTIGFWVAVIGPPLVTVVGIVAAIILLARRRVAFWVPLVASVLAFGVLFLGAVIVVGSVPGATL